MLERLGTFTASPGPPVSHKSASCGGRGIRGRKEGGAELWPRILLYSVTPYVRESNWHDKSKCAASSQDCGRCHGAHITCHSGQKQLRHFLPPLTHPITRQKLLYTGRFKNNITIVNFGVWLWFVKRTSQDHDHHYLHLLLVPFLLHFFLPLENYNPMWTFSFDAIRLHSFQSLAPLCQLCIPTSFWSSSTSSFHLVRSLPLYRKSFQRSLWTQIS